MGAMRLEPVTVRDEGGSGETAIAMLSRCGGCGGRQWLLYTIEVQGAGHLHMQCVACNECYCDGICGFVVDVKEDPS